MSGEPAEGRDWPILVDRDAPAPFHYQLREHLRRRIEAGEWGPHEPLPGEKALCEQAGVARSVVRQALGDLVHDGLLERRQGVGTFVAQPKITEGIAGHETGFYDDMVRRGHEVSTKVVRAQLEPASLHVARDLGLAPASTVIAISRVRDVDSVPTVYVESWLPARMFPGFLGADLLQQLAQTSLYRLIEEQYGIRAGRSRRLLGAVGADEEISALLGIQVGDPLVVLNSVSYIEAESTPFEAYRAYHRGDRTIFEVESLRAAELATVTAAGAAGGT